MKKEKLDTRAIGLDVSLTFSKWLTGTENLHYGDWTGLDVCAANAGRAMEAYSDRLFSYLPDKSCRILDIGGGAGVTAGKLLGDFSPETIHIDRTYKSIFMMFQTLGAEVRCKFSRYLKG